MKSTPKAMKAGAKATRPASMTKKSMSKGPKKPMPNDPKPTDPATLALIEEGQRNTRKRGLKIGLPFFGGTLAVGIPAVARKSEEARLDAKGSRQEYRAGKKTVRANRVEEAKPAKAAKLREKAAALNAKGAANKKAAEIIYKSKQKGKK
jgi:hypothetical protein